MARHLAKGHEADEALPFHFHPAAGQPFGLGLRVSGLGPWGFVMALWI